MAESSGDADAISPTGCFGLWQINGSHGGGHLHPLDNAKAAVLISGGPRRAPRWAATRPRQAAASTTHSPHRTRPRHCCPNTRYSLRH